MSDSDFVAYVGPPELHDGYIVEVQRQNEKARVVIRGASGRLFAVEFCGVQSVKAHRAEGMLLYSLSEMKAAAPLRRFVFVNWDEEDDASLEIVARELSTSALGEKIEDG
jgi:hypothetical protein